MTAAAVPAQRLGLRTRLLLGWLRSPPAVRVLVVYALARVFGG